MINRSLKVPFKGPKEVPYLIVNLGERKTKEVEQGYKFAEGRGE